MLERAATRRLIDRLGWSPAVLLLGPRQVGKTTLARQVAARHPGSVFLDLESRADRARLAEPELFFARHRDRLVILDQVQLMPDLFAHLRPEIDADRRPGRFLLLGSAAGDLLRQRAESLAGRVAHVELTPLLAREATSDLASLQQLWLRGGFPRSALAASDRESSAWRQDFIATFLQRDLRDFGVNVPADTLSRFWRMLAHLQGQVFNASQLGASLGGASHTTVARYLSTLVDAMVVRRLEPHLPNIGKRLVKSPKVYVRDSGLVHTLLGIDSLDTLQGHPIVGASWEGFVIEQVAAMVPEGTALTHYRTATGNEMDLVVEAGGKLVAIEIKFSSAPSVGKGFWVALEDMGVDRAYVVAPVREGWPLAKNVEVVPIEGLPWM
jgi:predicted AAA+ superfamily ATPase